MRELVLPPDYDFCKSWNRAVGEQANISPINEQEWMVRLGSGSFHRVAFVLMSNGRVQATCDCESWKHRSYCAHIALIFWKWVRGRIMVYSVKTDSFHQEPPYWVNIPVRKESEA